MIQNLTIEGLARVESMLRPLWKDVIGEKSSDEYKQYLEDGNDSENDLICRWIKEQCGPADGIPSKRDFKNIICKWLLHHGAPPGENCFQIYGGFIRDTIIRGEDALDIDVSINPETDVGLLLLRLNIVFQEAVTVIEQDEKKLFVKRGRDVYCAYIEPKVGQWHIPIEIQFVNSSGFRNKEVDLTCNALVLDIDHDGLFAKEEVNYERCFQDILHKRFACVIDMCAVERRVQKMRFRGWRHRRIEQEDVPGRLGNVSAEAKRQAMSRGQIPLDMGGIVGGVILWEWQQARKEGEQAELLKRQTRDKEKFQKMVKKAKRTMVKV